MHFSSSRAVRRDPRSAAQPGPPVRGAAQEGGQRVQEPVPADAAAGRGGPGAVGVKGSRGAKAQERGGGTKEEEEGGRFVQAEEEEQQWRRGLLVGGGDGGGGGHRVGAGQDTGGITGAIVHAWLLLSNTVHIMHINMN